jgi:hypothetical protein
MSTPVHAICDGAPLGSFDPAPRLAASFTPCALDTLPLLMAALVAGTPSSDPGFAAPAARLYP